MKFLSLLLSFIMTFTALPLQSLMNRGQDTQTNTEAVIENDDVTLEGGGGIGGLLTESIQQSQQKEAEKDEEENVSIENKILDVVMTDNIATVSFNNDKICKIIVAVFDEEGKEMLAHGMLENIEEYAETAYVTIDNGTIPQYYLLRAFLLDENNVALHKSFESNYYTKAFQEFLAKTTDDFEGDEILSLDDDKTNNFGVFNEGVIKVTAGTDTNVLVSEDHDTKTYVFEKCDETMTSLANGNILYFIASESNYIIVKISDITVDGTTVTIIGGDVALDEVFKYLKIDTSTVSSQEPEAQTESEIPTVQGAVDENGLATESTEIPKQNAFIDYDDENTETFERKFNKKVQSEELGTSLTVSGSLNLTVGATFKAYLDWGFAEVKFTLFQNATATITIEGKIKRTEITLVPVVLGFDVIDLEVGIDVNLILEAYAKFTFTVTESSQIGFSFVSKKGFVDLTQTPQINTDKNLEGKAYIGIALKPHLSILTLLDLSMNCEIGLEARVKDKKIENSGMTRHTCAFCVEGSTWCVPKINVKLIFDIRIVEAIEEKYDLYKNEYKLSDFYISSDLGYGTGTCPNDKYLIRVIVCDEYYQPLVGANVNGITTDSFGTVDFFLPRGTMIINVSKSGYKTKTLTEDIEGPESVTVLLTSQDKPETDSDIVIQNAKVISSGSCGNNVKYRLYDIGILYIYGTGDMTNYSKYSSAPWYSNRSIVKKVVIENGVTSIGKYAIYGCPNLASITIPDSIIRIVDCAIPSCDSLTSVTIPDSVISIGQYAFQNCKGLTSVTIGNSVKSIGRSAFYGCLSLTSVTIPDSVTSIGNKAFYDCSSLKDVYYGGIQSQWNKISIGTYNDTLKNATIHFNSAGPVVYASTNVKTLAVREYEVPKMLAESSVIAEPAANTVTKDDLVAGAVYTLIIIKGTQYDYELTNDSLLYITDAIADENGVATFTHYCNSTDISWVAVVYGACNHHASDWITVAEPTFTEKGLKAQYCTKCSETLANEEIDIIPEKMVIESLPEKLTYSYGDTLDLTGLTVKYTYTDGRENVSLSESDYTVYGFDAYAFGVQTILIESGIYKARFDITVDLTVIPDGFTDKIDAGATVESLAELYPDATVYALTADGEKTADGDELLKTGMILQIVQPDGTVNSMTVIVKGDATGDGIVNGKDIIRVKKQISQGNAVEHIEYADINSDGVVNEDDITALMSF